MVSCLPETVFEQLGKVSLKHKNGNTLQQGSVLCDYVLGAMKCGITDMSSGS